MEVCSVCKWANVNLRRCAGCGCWMCYGCWYDMHDLDNGVLASLTWDGEAPIFCETCEPDS